jgi:hypothetical protein
MGGLHGGIELNLVPLAAPQVTDVREEVVDLVNIGIHRGRNWPAECKRRNAGSVPPVTGMRAEGPNP